ncbi:MAG: cytochrome c biogenesis protein CcsA [Planctomycetota bacterium]|jgi:cytochrome c-type biogenesis protein CcmF
MAEVGHLALLSALVLSSCALPADLVGKWKGSARLIRTGRNATILSFGCLSIAIIALMLALTGSEFGSLYVAWHNSIAPSSGHKGLTPWPGTAGSLLNWSWVQIGLVLIAFGKCREDHRRFCANARVTANLVNIFLLLVLTFEINPFAFFGPLPPGGAVFDLRLHNPILLMGYASSAVLLAWSFAWLKWDPAQGPAPLFKQVRYWVLPAWLFLTVGVVFGVFLIYRQVGPGGGWLNEVVRDVSLMSWLPATALLFGSRILKRDAAAAKWTVVLSLITVTSCILATFLGRPEMPAGARRLFVILLIHIWALAAILVWRRCRRSRRPDETSEARCHS